jgi:hypothetical protein
MMMVGRWVGGWVGEWVVMVVVGARDVWGESCLSYRSSDAHECADGGCVEVSDALVVVCVEEPDVELTGLVLVVRAVLAVKRQHERTECLAQKRQQAVVHLLNTLRNAQAQRQ